MSSATAAAATSYRALRQQSHHPILPSASVLLRSAGSTSLSMTTRWAGSKASSSLSSSAGRGARPNRRVSSSHGAVVVPSVVAGDVDRSVGCRCFSTNGGYHSNGSSSNSLLVRRTPTPPLHHWVLPFASHHRLGHWDRQLPTQRRCYSSSAAACSVSAASDQPRAIREEDSTDGTSHPNNNSVLLNVSAVHVAQTIDLYPCLSDLMTKYTFRKQASHKNSVLIELSPTEVQQQQQGHQSSSITPYPRYVAMYRFGSLVFVNCPPQMVAEFSHSVKRKHAVQPVPNGLERRENYGILLQPAMMATQPAELESIAIKIVAGEQQEALATTHPKGRGGSSVATPSASLSLATATAATTGDYCVLNELDMNAISVVSNVMAQTVALDTYNDMVDDLLAKFAKINHKVTQTGWVPDSERAFLFKTIAQNHIIFNDMISKLRIKDRSDTAWNLTRYEATWYGMRDEFEMDERFENMEFKLKLIEQNAKFFVEALQSQKSNTLEWIIVVLIAVECVIMTADMTGMGEALLSPMLEHLKDWWGWSAAPPSGGVDASSVGTVGSGADVLASSSSSSASPLWDADPTTAAPPGSDASSPNHPGTS